MRRVIAASIFLGGATMLVWTHHETLGLEEAWPVALGFALGSLAGTRLAATAISAVAGIVAGWAVFVVITLMLPFIPLSFGIAAGVAVMVLALAAGAVRGGSLPSMLAGFATFFAVYEQTWIDDRPGFLGDSASAAATLAVALLGGMMIYGALDGVFGFARVHRTVQAPAEIDLRERLIDVSQPPVIDVTQPPVDAEAESRRERSPSQGGFRPRGAH